MGASYYYYVCFRKMVGARMATDAPWCSADAKHRVKVLVWLFAVRRPTFPSPATVNEAAL